jgi:ubiquitin-like 1-activating enzyme E1 A
MEQINFTNNLNEIEEDKYELYDRNIRLWGRENQLKLSKSHVLLININTVVTELAKNLLLSGINLYIYDKRDEGENWLVVEGDIGNNYFLNLSHLGQERIKVLINSLSAINQFASVKELQNLEGVNYVQIQCVCIGFTTFEKLVKFS